MICAVNCNDHVGKLISPSLELSKLKREVGRVAFRVLSVSQGREDSAQSVEHFHHTNTSLSLLHEQRLC